MGRHETIGKRIALKLRKAHIITTTIGFYLEDVAPPDDVAHLNSLLRDGDERSFVDRLAEVSEALAKLVDVAERGNREKLA